MITLSVETLLTSQLPDEYDRVAHCLYIVRDGLTTLYVGKAERQSTHERLLQHLAANVGSDYYGHANGPSELGKHILANAPRSNTWPVDLLTWGDCQILAKPTRRSLTVAQAEKLLIQTNVPLLNKTNRPAISAVPATSPTPTSKPDRTLPAYAMPFIVGTSQNTRTQNTYRYALIRFQQFAEANELTATEIPFAPNLLYPEILEHFLTWLSAAGLKNNSIRTFIAVIKQYLLWLQAERLLPQALRAEDLLRVLERQAGPHLRNIPPEHRQAEESVGELLSYYSSLLTGPFSDTPRQRRQKLAYLRNAAIIQTLYSTAGRAGEVAALTRATVLGALVSNENVDQLLRVEGVAAVGRSRMISLTPEAQRAIRAYLQERDRYALRPSEYKQKTDAAVALFVRHDRDASASISTKTVWQIVNEAAKAVFGIDARGRPLKRVGPQQIRLLRAQHLYMAGMPLDTLQAILGHGGLLTTRKAYADASSPKRIARELEQYGRAPTERSMRD